jgi:hypothetical protein
MRAALTAAATTAAIITMMRPLPTLALLGADVPLIAWRTRTRK